MWWRGAGLWPASLVKKAKYRTSAHTKSKALLGWNPLTRVALACVGALPPLQLVRGKAVVELGAGQGDGRD